ncbi:MAG: hypothetical protein QM772_04845 [Ottowia sp.]|uniref:hypothetical protein n=1 Tax=Ottowia sp. TaxID=1898956 RepID=UPI0039E470E6
MLRTTEGSLRFTAQEIKAFRALGIDARQVRTDDDFARVFGEWLDILADRQPDLFDKITRAMLADREASRRP